MVVNACMYKENNLDRIFTKETILASAQLLYTVGASRNRVECLSGICKGP